MELEMNMFDASVDSGHAAWDMVPSSDMYSPDNKRSYEQLEWFFGAETDGHTTCDDAAATPSPKMARFDFGLLQSEDDSFDFDLLDDETALSSTETLSYSQPSPMEAGTTQARSFTKAKRKKRDAAQLARCREHSARSRERRKAERAALDSFVIGKTEECDSLKNRIRTLESEAHYLKQFMVQNALTLQQQALNNPSVLVAALTAMAQVQAMSTFQPPQVTPTRRDSNGFTPICPRPVAPAPATQAAVESH
eukprot:comp20320_c0_seq1/m.25561 comp20320_c0_seq1/g.25561  ORF comp20320_c0_seq1/g.25561 comp20320_c0_seq1/m.25561 type:complete len:251 (-) comp20320_c0_seq1:235-987(-)